MSPDALTELWRAGGASVRGATHARAALPNQDALRWLPAPGVVICALSDGHGSDKSFRSDLGALFAVQTALAVVPAALVASGRDGPAALAQDLPPALVQTWRDTVEHHLAASPFTVEEWARLAERDGDGARAEVEANWWLAYGATFLLCVVTPDYMLYAQLGDGDILLVSPGGAVARPRWPRDPRLFANETTSLCMPDAWAEMRVDIQPFAASADGLAPAPALVLLATDGYSNSFVDEHAFARVGSDLLAMVRADGFDAVCAGLPAWLEETSRLGSGDDITVGLVYRLPVEDAPAGTSDLPGQMESAVPPAGPAAPAMASDRTLPTETSPMASDQRRHPESRSATDEQLERADTSPGPSEQTSPAERPAAVSDQAWPTTSS